MICRLDPNIVTYYASKQGRAHIANNIVCQDYSLADNIENDCQVVCRADRHGGKEQFEKQKQHDQMKKSTQRD